MNQRQNSRTNSGFQNKFWLEHPPPDYGQQMDLQDKEVSWFTSYRQKNFSIHFYDSRP